MGVWWLFALIVISSYTANLAAVMVGEKTFEELSGVHDAKVRSFETLWHIVEMHDSGFF